MTYDPILLTGNKKIHVAGLKFQHMCHVGPNIERSKTVTRPKVKP